MPKAIHGALDRFIEQCALAISSHAEKTLKRLNAGGANQHTNAIRNCPYPGCTNPGAGPRNRWFCREHARTVPVREQKRLLAERAKAKHSAARIARARGGRRKSDMRRTSRAARRGPRRRGSHAPLTLLTVSDWRILAGAQWQPGVVPQLHVAKLAREAARNGLTSSDSRC